MSEPSQSTSDPPFRAWEHLRTSSPPELRRWLNSGKPVALHENLMMVAMAVWMAFAASGLPVGAAHAM